jgi:effector-binding domain-containing protein
MRDRKWLVFGSSAVVVAIGILAASARSQEPAAITLKQTAEQVVLYTVHRGPYEAVGTTIAGMFRHGIYPTGAIAMVYLNSPEVAESAHLLTEIRFPVAETALAKAGTLGDFTDVKKVPALEWAVIKKHKGVVDQGALRAQLATWIVQNGYRTVDSCCEVMAGQMPAGGYADMETEIMYPVAKIAGE